MPRRKRKMRCLSWFEPTAELHQNPKPFEGRSTDWATAPRRSRRKIKKAALENSFWRMSFAFSFWRISKLWVKKGFVIDRRRDENNRNLFDHLLRWQNNPSITKRIFFFVPGCKKSLDNWMKNLSSHRHRRHRRRHRGYPRFHLPFSKDMERPYRRAPPR